MNCKTSYCFYSKYRYASDGTLKSTSCVPLFCDPKVITIKVSKKWAESQTPRFTKDPEFCKWAKKQLVKLHLESDTEILKQNT